MTPLTLAELALTGGGGAVGLATFLVAATGFFTGLECSGTSGISISF